MKPVQTRETNMTYTLSGGTVANDLPCLRVRPGFVLSEWELTDVEREAIANGARIELGMHSEPHPPVQLSVVLRDEAGNLTYADDVDEARQVLDVDWPFRGRETEPDELRLRRLAADERSDDDVEPAELRAAVPPGLNATSPGEPPTVVDGALNATAPAMIHNPWDAACSRHVAGEPTGDMARCPVCRPEPAEAPPPPSPQEPAEAPPPTPPGEFH
jgi:hypothetical protein